LQLTNKLTSFKLPAVQSQGARMSDIYFFKNKLDQLLKENQAGFEENKVSGLIELLKKLVIAIDEEVEQIKKKQKIAES
jgi:hypothetical protein